MVFAAAFAVACASAGAPPGGPEDHEPPEIVRVTPDSGATNAQVRAVEFQFDEVVSDRPSTSQAGVSGLFLISPRNGGTRASWRRSKITVRPERGFRENTAYKITLLPGLADLRGNVRREQSTVVFATGPYFPQFSILGRVFDWAAMRPAPGAYVEAISRNDTSIVYLGVADSSGSFDVGPLPGGPYLVRGIIDQNRSFGLDRNEKWDSVTVVITDRRPALELKAIERDTVPPLIDGVTVIDSMTLRVTFDKPLDPSMQLQPSLVRIQRSDSSQIEVARVEWLAAFDRVRQARDSAVRADSLAVVARRADSIAAARRADSGLAPLPPRAPATQAPPVLTPGGARAAPPAPRPNAPPPDRGIVVTISPPASFSVGSTYRVTTRGIRNLLGKSDERSRQFTVPQPPRPAPTDTTRRPPADTTRRRPPLR